MPPVSQTSFPPNLFSNSSMSLLPSSVSLSRKAPSTPSPTYPLGKSLYILRTSAKGSYVSLIWSELIVREEGHMEFLNMISLTSQLNRSLTWLNNLCRRFHCFWHFYHTVHIIYLFFLWEVRGHISSALGTQTAVPFSGAFSCFLGKFPASAGLV